MRTDLRTECRRIVLPFLRCGPATPCHVPGRRITMARPLLTDAMRRRFADVGPQDEPDDAKVVVAAHFSLPGTGWGWYALAYDEDGGTPQCFCLVQGRALELGWVGLAELERLRSPRGLAVGRDAEWRECSLAALRRRL